MVVKREKSRDFFSLGVRKIEKKIFGMNLESRDLEIVWKVYFFFWFGKKFGKLDLIFFAFGNPAEILDIVFFCVFYCLEFFCLEV